MSDVAIREIARVERHESCFEQKHEQDFYSKQDFFKFPGIFEKEGGVSFDVSSAAWRHGIHTPVHLSGRLYCHWIRNCCENPIKNIATLCHAFLYHVDLDKENTVPLVFTVPGIGSEPYKARASLHGWRNEYIYLDVADE